MWGAVAGGAVSILGSLFGGNSQKKAAKRAAEAQAKAAADSLALQKDIYQKNTAAAQPFMDLGKQGLNALSDPNKNFMASPDYQYRLDQGLAGVTNNYATKGMLNSGAALAALQQRGQNEASGEFGNWWNRQSGLANIGQNALGSITGTGQNYANNAGNIMLGQGQNQADYQTTKGNINANMLGTLAGGLSSGIGAMSGTGWGNIGKNPMGGIATGLGGGFGGGIGGGMANAFSNAFRG